MQVLPFTSCVLFNIREKKIEGMKSMRTLAHYHPDSVKGNLPEVCVCLTEEVLQLVGFVFLLYFKAESPICAHY